MIGDQIINIARAQIGTKYKHQGRVPGVALDCAGLLAHIADVLGYDYIDVKSYGRIPHNGLMESTLDSQKAIKRVFEKIPGDILLMRFDHYPQHIAIYTGSTIIHCYNAVGMVCEHIIDANWESKIVRIYRFCQ